jgi:hypothetical protein
VCSSVFFCCICTDWFTTRVSPTGIPRDIYRR